MPLLFESFGLGDLVVRELGLAESAAPADLTAWRALVERIKRPKPELEIALVGKYIELPDAYLSVTEALRHAGWAAGAAPSASAGSTPRRSPRTTSRSGSRAWPACWCRAASATAASRARCWPRATRGSASVPYLGLCLGLQCGVIEFARDVVGERDANSTEFDLFTDAPGHRLHARPARASRTRAARCAWASTRRG